jgi:hypothetical protein
LEESENNPDMIIDSVSPISEDIMIRRIQNSEYELE